MESVKTAPGYYQRFLGLFFGVFFPFEGNERWNDLVNLSVWRPAIYGEGQGQDKRLIHSEIMSCIKGPSTLWRTLTLVKKIHKRGEETETGQCNYGKSLKRWTTIAECLQGWVRNGVLKLGSEGSLRWPNRFDLWTVISVGVNRKGAHDQVCQRDQRKASLAGTEPVQTKES